MIRKVIKTSKAPKAIGVYSQGIETKDLIFTSGQIPLTSDGELVKGNFELEVAQVINNLQAVLNHSGSDLSSIVKITVFLTDLSLFPRLNKVFEDYFKIDPPARSAVEVSALPMQVRVEMEAVALKK
tara:strand:+ start:5111 stop:5491 length:381 start_codon:yes stop_codon:yes gene_type:complete